MIARAVTFIKCLLFPANPRRCRRCGSFDTKKNGTRPITWRGLGGAKPARHQNWYCKRCRKPYYVEDPRREKGRWYPREVFRKGLDMYFFVGGSWRRTAEWLRSEINPGSERSRIWNPLRWRRWRKGKMETAPVRLSHTTLWRRAQRAGGHARAMRDRFEGLPLSGVLAGDETAIKLRGVKVGLHLLVDGVTGVVLRLVRVASASVDVATVQAGFEGLQELGLDLGKIRVWLSDGASAYEGALQMVLWWVRRQRCVFHLFYRAAGPALESYRASVVRQLRAEFGKAAEGLAEVALQPVRQTLRRLWLARSEREAVGALYEWMARWGTREGLKGLGEVIRKTFVEASYHLKGEVEGLGRTSNCAEGVFRRYKPRFRLIQTFMSESGADNYNALWQLAYNLEPYQRRSERKRRYPKAGKCPLEVAGMDVKLVSWLDVVRV